MTKDEVLKMLSRSGLLHVGYNLKASDLRLFEFSNLVNDHIEEMVMQEREECAKLCYELMCKENPYDRWKGMKFCMDAIRARGNK